MLGLEIVVLNAATRGEIDVAFETLARDRIEALFVAPDVFFNIRRVQLATLAARYQIPTAYAVREFADVGGLLTYGASIPMRFAKWAFTPAESSRVKNQPIYQWCSRASLSLSSTRKRPRQLV
jgi:hypothetical protein